MHLAWLADVIASPRLSLAGSGRNVRRKGAGMDANGAAKAQDIQIARRDHSPHLTDAQVQDVSCVFGGQQALESWRISGR